MDNTEIILALIGLAVGIVSVLGNVLTRRVAGKKIEAVSETLEKEKERSAVRESNLNERMQLNTEANRVLIESLTTELKRQSEQRETADKTHALQISGINELVKTLSEKIGRLEAENETLRQQVDGMERLYEDEMQQRVTEAERWRVERDDLNQAIEVLAAQHEERKALINQLNDRIQALETERRALLSALEDATRLYTEAQEEIVRLEARIQALETAKNDGSIKEIAPQSITE